MTKEEHKTLERFASHCALAIQGPRWADGLCRYSLVPEAHTLMNESRPDHGELFQSLKGILQGWYPFLQVSEWSAGGARLGVTLSFSERE